MYYLILTIIVSAFIYVIFKLFDQKNVHTFQAIVANYFTCAIIGFLFTGANQFQEVLSVVQPAIPYAVFLGLLFIIVFTFIGYTSQKFGVGITSIADKLSLIIPVVAAFILYNDAVTVLKITGIVLSVIAVYLAVRKKENRQHEDLKQYWYYPIVVFLGGGIIGTLLKQVQFQFPEINYNTFLIFLFGMAFLIGFIFLIIQLLSKKIKLATRSILAGVLLGIPNYFSIYFLMQSLNTPNWESSVVFPVMNIGIVVLSSVLGIILFKEQFSRKNTIGLLLAVLAIFLLLMDNLY